MIQSGFYNEPKNETVKIVLSDDHGFQITYKMVLQFKCDVVFTPPPVVKKKVIPPAILANITNITSKGNVTVIFNSRLRVPKVKLTEFASLNVTVDGKTMPVLELSIKTWGNIVDKDLEFSWQMVEFNTANMTIHLDFKYPKRVSENNILDYLDAKINGNFYFRDN